MRFGYCVNMLSLPGSDRSGREFLPMIAGLSFDYVELPLAQMTTAILSGFFSGRRRNLAYHAGAAIIFFPHPFG